MNKGFVWINREKSMRAHGICLVLVINNHVASWDIILYD